MVDVVVDKTCTQKMAFMSFFVFIFTLENNCVILLIVINNLNMLQETIKVDMIVAMKERNELVKQALRMLSAAMKNESIALKRELTVEDEIKVLSREVKRLREGAEEFAAAGRDDLAAGAKAELTVYEKYMPAQLSDEDLEGIVQGVVAEVGASSMADMGRVMGTVMGKVSGQADGGRVKNIVQKTIGIREMSASHTFS